MEKVIFTGGTGYIGGTLIDNLSNDYECINLGRNSKECCRNLYWNFYDQLVFPSGISAVVHSAAISREGGQFTPVDHFDVNVRSTFLLLEACRNSGVKHFIYLSTGGVYGHDPERPLTEEDYCEPQTFYARTKYLAEKMSYLYKNDMTITILRLFFPYGTKQKNSLIPKLIDDLKTKQAVTLNKNGSPVINPINIEDLCAVIKKVLADKIEGVYNVAGNESITVGELASYLANKLKIKNVCYTHSDYFAGSLVGDNEKLLRTLDIDLKIALKAGLDQIINSVIQEKEYE